MTKVYIEKQGAPAFTPSLVFWPNFRFEISPKLLFRREIMEQYQKPFFEIVSVLSAADFVAVPYEYFEVARYAPEYLKCVYAVAESVGKKVLLFDYSDFVDTNIRIPDYAIIFRVSAYRHHKKKNEIVMPYFVEDMGERYGILPEEKKEMLVVGYCGQSQFGSRAKALRAWLKWLFHFTRLCFYADQNSAAHQRGIFWRARALAALRRGGIATSFLERAFYSLHQKTAPRDPQTLRREYVENLRASGLALCIRGDANASQRFYEAMSAGRIPLFIDTDCVLPLEEIIPYDDSIMRVSSRQIKKLPEIVRSWEARQTPASFRAAEQRAREVYERFLRLDRYFEIVFDRGKSPYNNLLSF